jgi:HK97 family phage portal protein
MSIRSRIVKWLFKSVDVDSDLFDSNWNTVNWSTDNFASISKEGYEHVATVYRCVDLISKLAASLPLGVMEEGDEEPELVPKHTLLSQTLKRPNPIMSRSSFIKYWVLCLILGGRTFIWANRSSDGEILELWVLPPSDVTVHFGKIFGTITGYTWNYQGSNTNLDPEDVLYTWFPNPRNPMQPMSPLKAAAQEVDIENQGLKWNLSLLANAGKPSAYVSLPKDSEDTLKDDHVKEIKLALKSEYGGSGNVGKIIVFRRPGMTLTDFGWNPADMDWIKGLENSDVRIANVFSVPPELIGAQKTYENFAVANKVLYLHAIIPVMDLFCDEMTAWDAINLEENQWLTVLKDLIKALQEDQTALSDRVVQQVGAGLITRNEGRADLKRPPSDDPMADVLTVGKEVATLGVSGLNIGTEDIGDGEA